MFPYSYSSTCESCLCFIKNVMLSHCNYSNIHNSTALKTTTLKRVNSLFVVAWSCDKSITEMTVLKDTQRRGTISHIFSISKCMCVYGQLWTCLVLLRAICGGFHCHTCFVFSWFYSWIRAFDVTRWRCITRTWSLNCSHVSQDCCWRRQGWSTHVITHMSSILHTLF